MAKRIDCVWMAWNKISGQACPWLWGESMEYVSLRIEEEGRKRKEYVILKTELRSLRQKWKTTSRTALGRAGRDLQHGEST